MKGYRQTPMTPKELPGWLGRAKKKVRDLRAEPSTEYMTAPSVDAGNVADAALEQLYSWGRRPTRIAPLADGGISIRFHAVEAGRASARIEVDNEGGLLVVVERSVEDPIDYLTFDSAKSAVAALVERLPA